MFFTNISCLYIGSNLKNCLNASIAVILGSSFGSGFLVGACCFMNIILTKLRKAKKETIKQASSNVNLQGQPEPMYDEINAYNEPNKLQIHDNEAYKL